MGAHHLAVPRVRLRFAFIGCLLKLLSLLPARLAADSGVVRSECESGALQGYLMMPSSPFAHSTLARMRRWRDQFQTPRSI